MSTPKQDDGGPAFPIPGDTLLNGEYMWPEPGMTLRQYAAITLRIPRSGTPWLDEMIEEVVRNEFAGQALAGMLANERYPDMTPAECAVVAYSQADAMLAERRKEGEEP